MKENINYNSKNINADDKKRANIKHGMLSGLVASALSSLVLVLLTSLVLIPEFDYIAIQGSIFGLAGSTLSAWGAYFLVGALIWGPLYAVLESRLSGGVYSKGVLFGLLTWIIVMVIFMPIAGQGFFLQKYTFSASGIMLVVDLIFGLALAYFYKRLK